MSGSGGGSITFNSYSDRFRGSNPDRQQDECNLQIHTQLVNPDPNLIVALTVNSKLIVVLDSSTQLLTVQDSKQAVFGVISPPNLQKLINCILAGNEYSANITKINGGHITVEIHRNL
jgi:hypothetical protein